MKVIWKQEYILNYENVDQISEQLKQTFTSLNINKNDVIRFQYSIEPVLLDCIKFHGTSKIVELLLYRTWTGTFLSLKLKGERYNPIKSIEQDEYMHLLLENISITPDYEYTDEEDNLITYKIPRKKQNETIESIGAIVLAIIANYLLKLCPETVGQSMLTTVLHPIGNIYLSLISTCGILMIFLSLIVAISQMSSIQELKSSGSVVLKHFMFKNIIYGCIFAVGTLFVLSIISNTQVSSGDSFEQIAYLFFDFFPVNIIDPFQQKNALQVAFMAVVLGIFILINKKKSTTVISFFVEMDRIVMDIIKYICSFFPAYVFVSVLELLISGQIAIISRCYIMMMMILGFAVFYVVTSKIISAVKYKVSITDNFRYTFNIALIGFFSTSSMACLGNTRKTCISRFNTNEETLDFSLMIQQVFYKADMLICFICCFYGICQMFGVTYSISSYIIMTITVILMALVAPPVPGGAVSIMTSLFLMASVPDSGVQLFVAIFFCVDMICTGAKGFCISDEMIALDRKLNT